MSTQNPLSSAQEKANPGADSSSQEQDQADVPRSAVGVVNEAGEIIDKDGNAIGKIAESKDPQSLAGNTVTAAGEVLNSTGDVVGKALGGEYTTEGDKGGEKAAGGGFFGGAKGVLNTVGSLHKPVTGFLGGQQKKAASAQSDAPTPAEDKSEADQQTEAGSQIPDEARSQVPDDAGSQIPDEARSQAPDDAGSQLPDDATDVGKTDIPDEAGSQVPDEARSQLPDDATDAGKTEIPDEAESQVPDEARSQLPDDATDAGKTEVPDAQEAGSQVQLEDREGGDDVQSKIGDKDEAGSQILDGDTNPDVPASQVGDDAQSKLGGEEQPAEGEEQPAEGEEKPAEGEEKPAEEEEKKTDYSILKGTKVNKAGNMVNDNGDIVGRLIEGDAKYLQGKKADADGNVWDDSGKIVGKAEPTPEDEVEKKDFAPFENFPDAVVEGDGSVVSNGQRVGTVVDGDPKRLKGSKVDEDGDILDRRGNVVGKAEAWDEPEPIVEEEEVVDNSLLAGKRVNKAGNIVDSAGVIWGKVVEGNVSSMVGRMCDKEGNIRSESGDIVGKAQLVPESEREGSKEGPFAELSGCTVAKNGTVVTPGGDVVGRLISGDAKVLFGRTVDEDGDVLDRNGNALGKAERWEEPEPEEKKKGPLAGRKVNREGNVLDDEHNVIAKLVNGDVLVCAGKEVDDDGDVINSKGNTVGHVALIEDIPAEPEESEEDKKTREQAEEDRKLAAQLGSCIEQSLEKIKPILRMITDKIDKAERTPKEELDEEELVKQVKPLIEEGNKILTETNGVIRGLDPDGRIQRNAKHKSGTKDASAEEHHLAEVLKELTGDVTQTIDNAKRKIEDMPHAKKELNPLWGLLSDPLIQILAAVGLLLNGVLGLVGKLLSLLGLGGLVDQVLGGLGINKLLSGLGLGSAYNALTGKGGDKDKKKK